MQYNDKVLTFPEDAFSAFAGMQTFLSRIDRNGLIYGHSEFYFDVTLSWMPRDSVTRRTALKEPRSDTVAQHLPSWSWVGWAGVVHMPWDVEFSVYALSVTDIDGFTSPVTEWFAMESPLAVDRRRIKSDWHKYRMLAQSEDSPLPNGWKRVDNGPEVHKRLKNNYSDHTFPREIPSFCFKHYSDSDDRFFWYPVPALDTTCKETIAPQPQTAYLFARTSRAFLYRGEITKSGDNRLMANEAPSLRITNSKGLHVGFLRLNNDQDVLWFETANASGSSKRLELVATCKGYTGRIFDKQLAIAKMNERGAKSWEKQLKDCYFVLWIEWVDHVAYRRGCGAVAADVWEEEREKELVDLVLG